MSGPTAPAEAHFDKGSWGWDLTQWRKLGLLWGYTDRLAERAFDLDDENERHWMEYNLDGLFAEVNGTYEPDEDLGQLYFPRMTVQGKPVNFGTPRFSFPPPSRKH